MSQEQERSSQNPQINFLAIWEIRELHQANVCAVRSKSQHPVRLWENSFPSRPEESEAFSFSFDSPRGAQLCKSLKVIGEEVNIHVSESSWIHHEQEDASFKLVYGSWITFQHCGCDNEFHVLFWKRQEAEVYWESEYNQNLWKWIWWHLFQHVKAIPGMWEKRQKYKGFTGTSHGLWQMPFLQQWSWFGCK